jgi:hypothetical protein
MPPYILWLEGLNIVDEDWIKHWVHVKNLDEKEKFEHGEGDIWPTNKRLSLGFRV